MNVESFKAVLKALHEHEVGIGIMDRVGEVFKYDDLEYEIIESQGIPIRVATIESLIKLKKGTSERLIEQM
jgi:hypothetical protein